MFDTVLVANRAEIAIRVIRTLRKLGIRSVAVYSDADAGARHVAEADEAVRIGPGEARLSYLSIPAIIDAAISVGAQAIHPGYGFLSESAEFASACEKAGIVFIGPPSSAIEAMGDKIRAKRLVAAAGVPVVPGRSEHGASDADLIDAAGEIGYPVLLKPSAGGGGKGMRLVTDAGQIADAIAGARREARTAFADDTLLIERFVSNPRHIEIQILADAHGNVIHLGERECSLQRRHQKIVEEAPSPLLTGLSNGAEIRQKMGEAAINAARSCGYVGAGTIEFIVSHDKPDEFFFMEMNTRLQVEHPVTEMVTGIDLVEQQIKVAAGQPLAVESIAPQGHAIEVRVYAEDPDRGFLPTGGRVLALREPTNSIRVDSALAIGSTVSSDYDPMLGKYIAHGSNRDEALRVMRAALAESFILGMTTNIAFLRRLLDDSDVKSGAIDTGLVDRKLPELTSSTVPDEVFVAAAMERALALEPANGTGVVDPWDIPGGWRIGEPSSASWRITAGDTSAIVRLRGRAADAEVVVGRDASDAADDDPGTEDPARSTPGVTHHASAHWDGDVLVLQHNQRTKRYPCVRLDEVCWLAVDGRTFALTETSRLAAARRDGGAHGDGPIVSPMPGTVLSIKVAAGESVRAKQPLMVVEAMKMEHTISAPRDGVVNEVLVDSGQQVALNQPLVVVSAVAADTAGVDT